MYKRQDYTGQQITRQEPTVGGSIASFVDNAGSSTIKGFELEGNVVLFAGLSASFGYGYTDAKFNEYLTKNAAGTVINNAATAVFQNTPKNNGNFTLNYARNLSDGSKIAANIGASYRSPYHMFEAVNPALDQNDAYTLVDAGVSVSYTHLDVYKRQQYNNCYIWSCWYKKPSNLW